MRFSCGKCGQRYKADESFAGEEIECSKCGALVLIPNIEPPPIKIVVPEIKKSDIETSSAEKIKVPKLTLPASLTKKSPDNKTESTPSFNAPRSSGDGLSSRNTGNTPSLGMSNQIKERLGQNTGNTPSLGISNQIKEKLGQSTANTPSLGISNQIKERLQA
jgi:DNA-directed RNA polymerase subunit RPC12/RpoP